MPTNQPKNQQIDAKKSISIDSPDAFINRELSWLAFSGRVLAMVRDIELPLFERLKFAGILGMLHDEFFMKRMSGLKQQVERGENKKSIDGRTPDEQYFACRQEIIHQVRTLFTVLNRQLKAELKENGYPVLDYQHLTTAQKKQLHIYFLDNLRPVLTPLAVDAEHPFPFISSLCLNLAVRLPQKNGGGKRFVRVKIPDNLDRFVALGPFRGFVPLEQIIAANLPELFPGFSDGIECYFFRVTRSAEGETDDIIDYYNNYERGFIRPGTIISQVSMELKARRFAEAVRLQVDQRMPDTLVKWLAMQLNLGDAEIYRTGDLLGLRDLREIKPKGREKFQFPHHEPVTHPRLRDLESTDPGAIFNTICERDILVHHPYYSFDTSVLAFIRSAAFDPDVLAIKLTIYRTSSDSPIIRALVDASRNGKQVAVLIEVTARFDEAPNISWGKLLEKEGVHVAYGVERLKTHVKLALVIRREGRRIKQYLHVGTGNYHTVTAGLYEDLGLLTCDPELCDEAATVLNELTGAISSHTYKTMLIAPHNMRERFREMIQREASHARAGRPSGIRAKMNQLQDPQIITELYRAGQAGVTVTLIVRGLCCLRPGVPDLSDNIRVYSVVGRFLEHSRIYEFTNGGQSEYYIGSADWMTRNLDRRVETIAPVKAPELKKELENILDIYQEDNASAWDCDADGVYHRRCPGKNAEKKAVQERLLMAAEKS